MNITILRTVFYNSLQLWNVKPKMGKFHFFAQVKSERFLCSLSHVKATWYLSHIVPKSSRVKFVWSSSSRHFSSMLSKKKPLCENIRSPCDDVSETLKMFVANRLRDLYWFEPLIKRNRLIEKEVLDWKIMKERQTIHRWDQKEAVNSVLW